MKLYTECLLNGKHKEYSHEPDSQGLFTCGTHPLVGGPKNVVQTQ